MYEFPSSSLSRGKCQLYDQTFLHRNKVIVDIILMTNWCNDAILEVFSGYVTGAWIYYLIAGIASSFCMA